MLPPAVLKQKQLHQAYLIGQQGLACPLWAGDRNPEAHAVWVKGHDEFTQRNVPKYLNQVMQKGKP